MDEEPTAVALSRAEQRFDRWRRTVGLFLGPAAFAVVWRLPFESLAPEAHRLAAVMALVVVYWACEAVPLAATAVLGAALAVILGIGPAEKVLAPFAHPIIFLFIGSFIIARAMELHGLQRRLAIRILQLPGLASRPRLLVFGYTAFCAALSMFISNTAATAMMYPLGLGLAAAVVPDQTSAAYRRLAANMMLLTAFAASAGGLATPVGTPPNLIAIGLIEEATGYRINFVEWMTFGLPLAAAMVLFLFLVLGLRAVRGGVSPQRVKTFLAAERGKLGKLSAGERNVALAFGAAVTFWILPGVVALVAGPASPPAVALQEHLPEGVVAVAAASLLFLLPVSWRERRFTIGWGEAVGIDWGTILLFGGGMALGALMMGTGLASALGAALQELTGARSLWAVAALGAAFALLLSESSSNTASANVVIPPVVGLAQTLGLTPIVPALAACFGASFGFMLPVSTPPNAIIYGSGKVPILKMIRVGVIFDLVGVAAILLVLRLLYGVLPGA
jgi:sodium-dependent dicarboxylate transporter 2/3/5